MKIVLPLMFLLMSLASAQTTTTYQSSTGTVSPGNAVTGHLDLGGSFVSPYGMGTTASFNNFAGSANFTNQFDVKVQGTASGYDSTGAFVTVGVNWAWAAYCRSGRGGGCTKKYISGDLNVTR